MDNGLDNQTRASRQRMPEESAAPCRALSWARWTGGIAAAAVVGAALVLTGCGESPSGEAKVSQATNNGKEISPDVLAFDQMFVSHCAGCHGMTGNDGSAPPLNDALFLNLASHEYLYNTIANGRPKHMMPTWLKSKGGELTSDQIDKLIRGMREKWKVPVKDAAGAPPLALQLTPSGKLSGDPTAGAKIYAEVYAEAQVRMTQAANTTESTKEHKHAGKPPSVWMNGMSPDNRAWYLRITSNQLLRRLLITGRAVPFHLPDYRQAGLQSPLGKPLTSQQIADVVAYLAQLRKDVSTGPVRPYVPQR